MAEKNYTLYNSDASERGYAWSNAINDYIYIESDAMEKVDDLTREEIDALIEDGVAFIWDADCEWDDFKGNFQKKMDEQYAYVLYGSVRAWDGTYAGGKVFDGVHLFDDIFHSVARNAEDMDVTIDNDGDMVISTYDHDGGMTMYVRAITSADIEYYNENPDELEDSEMGARLFERGIKAEKFIEGYY